jgi:ribonuclease VapC
MILDTSSLVAILAKEPDFERYVDAISRASRCRMSAGNFLELSMVIEGQIEPVTVDQAHAARQAFHDFGKGRHPEGLNFGDCFAYALAKITGEPLLFKGDDFKNTDIVSAL